MASQAGGSFQDGKALLCICEIDLEGIVAEQKFGPYVMPPAILHLKFSGYEEYDYSGARRRFRRILIPYFGRRVKLGTGTTG
jgi:hypothetical protein